MLTAPPIVQQTSFWSKVKERMGMNSSAFEFSIRNSDIYSQVGGFSYTNADLILFFQYLNQEDYIAYLPYGPGIEPSEENQGQFLEELSESLRSHLPKHCIAPYADSSHSMYGLYTAKSTTS